MSLSKLRKLCFGYNVLAGFKYQFVKRVLNKKHHYAAWFSLIFLPPFVIKISLKCVKNVKIRSSDNLTKIDIGKIKQIKIKNLLEVLDK